ncbi:helix-turn-helix domain-containing protein [Brevibacillus brevis]|uniref:PucR family transcriptional regulator n=1 Tax=Brevibacillus brevis TaxID=1393 RepID=UPI001F36A061|nr:helix-turn-helix domain-containing protein [Brevibacillus brevis]UIO44512.1 helix-turn-helix domain-containing protein [Brevibacillus brevis]
MENWKKDVEHIRQATNLPIEYVQVSQTEAAQAQQDWVQKGWEQVAVHSSNDVMTMILIETASWHTSARALLDLIFPHVDDPATLPLPKQIANWLSSIVSGSPVAIPAQLEAKWPWKEARVSFLLERCRPDRKGEWDFLQPLLYDFFEGVPDFIPLTQTHALLIVPVSMLDHQKTASELLEWASGLHDLISMEWMEPVRLVVGSPITSPLALGDTLLRQLSLARALQAYRPQMMVAGDWSYPLERWAASLPKEIAAALANELSAVITVPHMTDEQLETLDTLFARQLNVSDTARQLFLHRNTLLYRLDKLTEQTGLDPRLFPDAVLLQLYLLFRQN